MNYRETRFYSWGYVEGYCSVICLLAPAHLEWVLPISLALFLNERGFNIESL